MHRWSLQVVQLVTEGQRVANVRARYYDSDVSLGDLTSWTFSCDLYIALMEILVFCYVMEEHFLQEMQTTVNNFLAETRKLDTNVTASLTQQRNTYATDAIPGRWRYEATE